MDSKNIVTLLQKVGAAAIMQDPPIVVENLREVLMSIDVSNITTYLNGDEAQNVNCAAALRGLEELSGRYFRNSRYKSLTAEALDIFCGMPRKHTAPKTITTTGSIVQPSTSAPVSGRTTADNTRKTAASKQHVATVRLASPPVAQSAEAATAIPAVDTSHADQLRDTDHSLHQPIRTPLRPMDASAAGEPHILEELPAIDDAFPLDEQHPIEFTAIQLYEQQLLAESLVPPRPFVEDGDFGEGHPPVVVDPAAQPEADIVINEPVVDEPPPATLVAPAPPGSPVPAALVSPTPIHPRRRRRRHAANDPNYRQPRMPPMQTIEDMQASVVGSIHRELAMRQLSQQARSQEAVHDAPVTTGTADVNAEAAVAGSERAGLEKSPGATVDAPLTTVTNAEAAVADSVRADLLSSVAANGTAALEPAQLSVANSMTPLIRITFADELGIGQPDPAIELVPSPQIDLPRMSASMQLANQYSAADALLSPSMQPSLVDPMMTSTPSRGTRSMLARELFAAKSPLPQPMLAALSPMPLVPTTMSPLPPARAARSTLPPVRLAARVSLPPVMAPIGTRSTADKAMDDAQQRSVLQPIDIELAGPTTAPQLMFGNAESTCGGGDDQWQRSSVKRVCRALRSAEVPLRAGSLIRRSTRLRQSSLANGDEPIDEANVSARQAFHTICNLHNKRVLKVRTNGENNAFDNVSLD